MHPLKNPGVLRNCQDLYLIFPFPFPFLWVWCTVNFEPVYVNVNSSFAEGLLGRYRFAHSQREMSKQGGNLCLQVMNLHGIYEWLMEKIRSLEDFIF